MPGFLRGSLTVNFISSFCRILANAYVCSRFKRFVDKCGVCVKQSTVYGLLSRYINKRAYFEYSLTYRLIMRIIRLLDRPVGAIGRFFKYLASGSDLIGSADALACSSAKSRLELTGITGAMLALGFTLGLLLKGGVGYDFMPPLAVSGAALVVYLMSYLTDWFKYSLLYRLIKWFIG